MMSETFSQTETFDIGKHIGENAKAGDIITLSGDLGVGKTVFAQGVAAGLGIKDHVCSPYCRFMMTEGFHSIISIPTG